MAAFDEEQSAAGAYAGSISELERRLANSDPGSGLRASRGAPLAAVDQRLGEEGDSRPSSRARLTASVRLCTPSLA